MITYVHRFVIPMALQLLPDRMRSQGAHAMLIAIGLQESQLQHRHQIGGPAVGLWQFEQGGGIVGVLGHPHTRTIIDVAANALSYRTLTPHTMAIAIEHNDVLAAIFARLLLWTSARPIPAQGATEDAWALYLDTWRPGAVLRDPSSQRAQDTRAKWPGNYDRAWRITTGEE